MVPAAPVADAAEPAAPPRDRDSALLAEFASMVQAPQYLMVQFRQMSADRAYIYRDCMLLKSQDTVAVNHVLRNQQQSLAYLGVADPQPFCQPARMVGGIVPRVTELFAETMEVHLSHQLKFMDFARKIEGACQDTSTNAYAVIKVTLQTDPMKDPIGKDRFGDMQVQAALYADLKRQQAEGQVPEGTADFQKLQDLENTLRVFLAGKMEEQIKAVPIMVPGLVPLMDPMTGAPAIDPVTFQPVMVPGMVPDPTDPREVRRSAVVGGEAIDILGCPELEQFTGFACDQVQPEDFRWDWMVTRPEDWPLARWMAHRVYMSPQEVSARFNLSKEDIDKLGPHSMSNQRSFGQTNSTDQDPNLRLDLESGTLNDQIAVWEVWHRVLGRRFVFVEGIPKFLVNEVPQAVGRRWFPFFPLYFTRTSGQTIGISDVQLVRQLQDEYNTLRSHDREARRSSYPVLFVQAGTMNKTAMDLYRNRLPFSIVEVNNAEDIKKQMQEAVVVPYNPAAFNTASVEADMQSMFGLPATVVGGGDGGMDLASQMALAKEGMETGVARRRIAVNRVITDIFQYMAEISLKVFPESYVKSVCGPMAVWPRFTSEELYTNIRIEVKGGISGQPRAKDRIDLWANFANVAQQLGLPVNGVEVLRELLDALGIRADFTRFILPPGVLPGMPVPGGAPGGPPGAQGDRGVEGGSPPMVERGAPDDLSQVPNHPPLPAGPQPPPPAPGAS